MDDWTVQEVLKMLEGGNDQLATFFKKQSVGDYEIEKKYKTKASRYYRESLGKHTDTIMEKGLANYEGR